MFGTLATLNSDPCVYVIALIYVDDLMVVEWRKGTYSIEMGTWGCWCIVLELSSNRTEKHEIKVNQPCYANTVIKRLGLGNAQYSVNTIGSYWESIKSHAMEWSRIICWCQWSLNRHTCPPLLLNSTQIPQVNDVTYLGVHLDRRLTWRRHLKTSKTKGQQLPLDS